MIKSFDIFTSLFLEWKYAISEWEAVFQNTNELLNLRAKIF